MGRVLFVDAAAGCAGDMLAGALLDLGWPLDQARETARAMGLEGVRLEAVRGQERGIAAQRLEVKVEGHQPHRHLHHIREMLQKLPGPVASAADKVFLRLAQAEAKVHGVGVEEVHFHEVGAADALVDVASFCAGLAWLGWPRLVCSPLPLGRGWVECAHGRIPLPAPAVVELLAGAPVTSWPEEGETVTPTGAALMSALAESFGPMPAMRLERAGVGKGTREGKAAPNVVRLFLGEEAVPAGRDQVVEIVCHLDDMVPEDLPLVLERFMAAGALDAAASPLVMKKGRLGTALTVLARPGEAQALAGLVLEQTPGLGVRLRTVERLVLEREALELASPWGPVLGKKARTSQGWRWSPEADEVARLCRETGLAPAEVRQRLMRLNQD